MSKDTGAQRPNKIEQYESSSAPAVGIVVLVSAVLAVVALVGTLA